MADTVHKHYQKFLDELDLYKNKDILNHYFETRSPRTGRIYLDYKRKNGLFHQGGDSHLDYIGDGTSGDNTDEEWKLEFRSQGSTRTFYFSRLEDALNFFILDSFIRSIPTGSISYNRKKMREDLEKNFELLSEPLRDQITSNKYSDRSGVYDLVNDVAKSLYGQGFVDPSTIIDKIEIVRNLDPKFKNMVGVVRRKKNLVTLDFRLLMNEIYKDFLSGTNLVGLPYTDNFDKKIVSEIDIRLGDKKGIYTKSDASYRQIMFEIGFTDEEDAINALNKKINSVFSSNRIILFQIPFDIDKRLALTIVGFKSAIDKIQKYYGFNEDKAIEFFNSIRENSSKIVESMLVDGEDFQKAKEEYREFIKPIIRMGVLKYY